MSALDAVQLVGMPESDCIIAQCAIYLARAPKSREVNSNYEPNCSSFLYLNFLFCQSYHALLRCKQDIRDWKGPLPSVPLHLRNAPTKMMKEMSELK